MKAAAALHASNLVRDEILRAIADAVLLVNYCICNAEPRFYMQEFREDFGTPEYVLRRIQGRLLERYRVEMNVPYERFYVSAEIGGGNGLKARHAGAAR